MRRLSVGQTGVLVVLTFILCIVLVVNHHHQALYSQDLQPPAEKTISVQRLLTFLTECAAIPPVVEHDKTCHHQPLPRSDLRGERFHLTLNISPSQPQCSGQSGLTGERLQAPRKLVLMFLLGFELDVLEISLREQQDLVDKIFLVESSATHRGVSQTPLL